MDEYEIGEDRSIVIIPIIVSCARQRVYEKNAILERELNRHKNQLPPQAKLIVNSTANETARPAGW